MRSGLAGRVTIMEPDHIDNLPWQPVVGCPGVRARELYRSTEAASALIEFKRGATIPGSPHPEVEHHIWVVAGTAALGDRVLPTGSYIHVPTEVAHPIAAVGASGCALLQVQHRCVASPTEGPTLR